MKPPREGEMAAHFRTAVKKINKIKFYLLRLALTRASRAERLLKQRGMDKR